MRKLNSLTLPLAAGQIGRLPATPDMGRRKQKTVSLIVSGSVTLVNNHAANPYNFTPADALALMRSLMGSWSMAWGRKKRETVDDKLTFDQFRLQAANINQRDQEFQGMQLLNYVGIGVDIIAPAGGTMAFRFAFVRPFSVERLGALQTSWCPGRSQMDQLQISILRGAAFSTNGGNVTIAPGNIDTEVYCDETPAEADDVWANVYRSHLNSTGGLKQEGPPGGTLLGVFETTTTGALTTLGLIDLKRTGDESLHESVEVKELVRDAFLREPLGGFDENNLATKLWQPLDALDLQSLTTAAGLELSQATLVLNPMQTLWVYAPAVSEEYVREYAAPNIADTSGPSKLIGLAELQSSAVPGHVASVMPVAALNPGDPKANLKDGWALDKGGNMALHLSPVQTQLHSAMGGNQDVALEATALRLASIPGGRLPGRNASVNSSIAHTVAKATGVKLR
jgi:hypothetical protein